jgi:hypothetical protein
MMLSRWRVENRKAKENSSNFLKLDIVSNDLK